MALTPRQKSRFSRDGFLTIPGAVPPALIAAARAVIRRRSAPGSGDYLSELSNEPPLLDLLRKSPLWSLAETLLGEGAIEPVTQAQLALCFTLPAAARGAKPPVRCHIDSWEADYDPEAISRHTLTIGVMLSDVPKPRMGNLTVFPGSHRLLARQVQRRGLRSVRAGLAKTIREVAPLQVTGKSGDAVLLHYQLGHDKDINLSPGTRCMAYFRLYHADAWRDGSPAYMKKAMTDLWLEWPGMRVKASEGSTARRARGPRARRSKARR